MVTDMLLLSGLASTGGLRSGRAECVAGHPETPVCEVDATRASAPSTGVVQSVNA
jgi:hypothetical protein